MSNVIVLQLRFSPEDKTQDEAPTSSPKASAETEKRQGQRQRDRDRVLLYMETGAGAGAGAGASASASHSGVQMRVFCLLASSSVLLASRKPARACF